MDAVGHLVGWDRPHLSEGVCEICRRIKFQVSQPSGDEVLSYYEAELRLESQILIRNREESF